MKRCECHIDFQTTVYSLQCVSEGWCRSVRTAAPQSRRTELTRYVLPLSDEIATLTVYTTLS
jgi:hypothetical protein